MNQSELDFLSNSRCQKYKERPNLSTNNGDMIETAKRHMMEWVCDTYVIGEKLNFFKFRRSISNSSYESQILLDRRIYRQTFGTIAQPGFFRFLNKNTKYYYRRRWQLLSNQSTTLSFFHCLIPDILKAWDRHATMIFTHTICL